jgi:hypothetical protein
LAGQPEDTLCMTTYELGFGKKGHMQQKVQQPHRRLSHPIDPQQPADLRQ